jgi:hypothetical protein
MLLFDRIRDGGTTRSSQAEEMVRLKNDCLEIIALDIGNGLRPERQH